MDLLNMIENIFMELLFKLTVHPVHNNKLTVHSVHNNKLTVHPVHNNKTYCTPST